MLEDEIAAIAEREGWSDRTTIHVLIGVLADLASHDFPPTVSSILNAIEERAHG